VLCFPFFVVVGSTLWLFSKVENFSCEEMNALTKKIQGQQKYLAEAPEDEVLRFPFFLVVCSTPGLFSKVYK